MFRDPDNTRLELYVRPDLDDMSLTDTDSDAAREALHSSQSRDVKPRERAQSAHV